MVKPQAAFTREKPSQSDLEIVQAQLGRAPRDVSAIAHRCACGSPDVVETPPRLADGEPFPTFTMQLAQDLLVQFQPLKALELWQK